MRHYEVMVILDAGLEEDAIRAVADRATQLITNAGGTVDKVDRWGKRRFAYEVYHRSEGYYMLIEATADPAALADVDRMLGLADDVIRHKIIRLPDKAVVKASVRSAADADQAPEAATPPVAVAAVDVPGIDVPEIDVPLIDVVDANANGEE